MLGQTPTHRLQIWSQSRQRLASARRLLGRVAQHGLLEPVAAVEVADADRHPVRAPGTTDHEGRQVRRRALLGREGPGAGRPAGSRRSRARRRWPRRRACRPRRPARSRPGRRSATSPPAYTPGMDVSNVSGSTAMKPAGVSSGARSPKKSSTGCWLIARIRVSRPISNSEPGTSRGTLRPAGVARPAVLGPGAHQPRQAAVLDVEADRPGQLHDPRRPPPGWRGSPPGRPASGRRSAGRPGPPTMRRRGAPIARSPWRCRRLPRRPPAPRSRRAGPP